MNSRSPRPLAVATRKADALWQEIICLGGKCLLCGRTATMVKLCGHHIKGKKARPDLRHVIANGVCVCWGVRGCHDRLHRAGQQYSEEVLRQFVPEQFALLDELRYAKGSSLVCEMEATCERLRHVLRAMQGEQVGRDFRND